MIRFAYYDSPFGPIRIGYENCRIQSIRCCDKIEPGITSPISDAANRQLQEYFAGRRKVFDLPIQLSGTPFQKSVWEALTHIPYGETRTYGQIADAIGKPKAARAVGMACNRNPMWILIPCHRVMGSKGALTGYAGGLSMKQALLDLEKYP